ncbi:MAG TPA: DUF4845 domain-containing protein [Azoarcus taiwanensis]|uniref:DUF4845 domain-containing protein n=1 Tax=Azoarcus taiwanensis TaxID=666964 RepID=A0A972FL42_9RHOO|nr:DUF4845 domain-containing protein [Azoarcus taiwanensis]NMG04276.1 DUF4845 domain-containing protein [Azoarcus taiwanensis]HRQ58807.1 DUF4845 domain-containing protein [Azoarcus taiwanensis]
MKEGIVLRNRQRGVSLLGLLIVGGLLAFALLLAFRSVPAVTEYMAVQRIIKTVADEGNQGATMADLRRSFDQRAYIDRVETITGRDLDIYKQGGVVVIEAEYERRVPIAGNVYLLFDFHATTLGR